MTEYDAQEVVIHGLLGPLGILVIAALVCKFVKDEASSMLGKLIGNLILLGIVGFAFYRFYKWFLMPVFGI